MRCQEGDHVPELGTRAGSTLLFSTTTRFRDIKQRRNCSFLTSSSIAITSVTVRSSGVLLETSHVFLMRFIVGIKSYMEVSSETSDKNVRRGGGVLICAEPCQPQFTYVHELLHNTTCDVCQQNSLLKSNIYI